MPVRRLPSDASLVDPTTDQRPFSLGDPLMVALSEVDRSPNWQAARGMSFVGRKANWGGAFAPSNPAEVRIRRRR
jgi:hypothetical protein